MAGVEAKFPQNPPVKTYKIVPGVQICLRILTVATTLAAAWVMLTNKQSIYTFGMTIGARYSYSSAFRFFAFANIVACAFSLLSLLVFICFSCRGLNPTLYFLLFIHDLFMMSLLLAGCSAATAIGYVAKYGESHSGWIKICNNFGRFCNRSTISVALSYLSFLFLLSLMIISANKSRQIQV